jgi:hypothetical protein
VKVHALSVGQPGSPGSDGASPYLQPNLTQSRTENENDDDWGARLIANSAHWH